MRLDSIVVATALVVVGLVGGSNGEIITMNLDHVASGGGAVGSTPKLTAILNDGGPANTVTLTLIGMNLAGTEAVKDWCFNLDLDSASVKGLRYDVKRVEGEFTLPSVVVGNGSKKRGNKDYNLVLNFATKVGVDKTSRFGEGDTCQIVFSGVSGLDVDLFDVPIVSHGDVRSYSAAHVISLRNGQSIKIVCTKVFETPEPSTLVLAVSVFVAGLGIGVRRRFAAN